MALWGSSPSVPCTICCGWSRSLGSNSKPSSKQPNRTAKQESSKAAQQCQGDARSNELCALITPPLISREQVGWLQMLIQFFCCGMSCRGSLAKLLPSSICGSYFIQFIWDTGL